MSYFVGLDVSLRSVSICVIDGDGKVVRERTVDFEIDQVIGCIKYVGPIERVGFEARVMSQHLFYGLQAEGLDVVCMEGKPGRLPLRSRRCATRPTRTMRAE